MKKIYLAGPDVFLPDAKAHGERLKALCARYGFEGLFPLDNELSHPDPLVLAGMIRDANIAMIRRCDGVIANLSPFRGPEPDSGTVWEVGFARGLGKPVIAYSRDRRTLKARTIDQLGLAGDASTDREGLALENFGLSHNLMFAENVTADSFEEALALLAQKG